MKEHCPIDPADPQFSADPFPAYDQLRTQGPLARVRLPNNRDAWFVTSTEVARQVLMDNRFSARPPTKVRMSERAGLENHMLNTDAPEHTRLRRLVAGTFSTARVDALLPRIEEFVDDLLDEFYDQCSRDPVVDVVDAFAFPLPVAVMCEVLGVPREDRHQLRGWTYVVSAPRAITGELAQSEAWKSLHDYFDELIAAKRRCPEDDLFSHLTHANENGESLSTEELLSMAFLLLFAGYETTMNLIAGGVLTLASHPRQLRACTSDTTGRAWEKAVEELLRYVSPLEGATWRFTREDIEVDGVRVPRGASVLVSLAAANHDAQNFTHPHEFDIDRLGNRHVAFGHGPHHCIGARLARIEGKAALSRLFERFPDLRIVDNQTQIAWRPGLLVRGPRHLNVRTDNPTVRFEKARESRRQAGLQRELDYRASASQELNLASNDYLGLSRHPNVVEATAQAARDWGAGSTASRLVCGSFAVHQELEEALAGHLETEAALVFSSGYLANLGAITALTSGDDLIVSDATNHASIVDACRLSRAKVDIAPHREPEAFAKILAERGETNAIAVTDSVFSVDGECAPLSELAAQVRRTGALLVVDEAHALGVIGEKGQGAVVQSGIAGGRDVIVTATLSKSLASQGGVVAGSRAVIDHIANTARPFIFDTGLAPTNAAAALAALNLLRGHPSLASAARTNAQRVAQIARGLGLVVSQPDAAVCSVLIGDPATALEARELCLSLGLRVGCFRPPSVPDQWSRLRLTARADLSQHDFDRIEFALKAIASQYPAVRR